MYYISFHIRYITSALEAIQQGLERKSTQTMLHNTDDGPMRTNEVMCGKCRRCTLSVHLRCYYFRVYTLPMKHTVLMELRLKHTFGLTEGVEYKRVLYRATASDGRQCNGYKSNTWSVFEKKMPKKQ